MYTVRFLFRKKNYFCRIKNAVMPNNKNLSGIKTWAEDDRPREKLIQKGTAALSDTELLAILIGSGTGTVSAVDLAKNILAAADNNLNELGKFTLSDLQKHKGIGQAKSVTIVAALEIGRRRKASQVLQRRFVNSSKDVFEIFGNHLGDLRYEEFWALYLDRKNSIVKKAQIGVGGIDSTVSDIRKMMKIGLETNAGSMIVCHNHPSGNVQPGQADVNLTNRLRKAGKLMDIPLVDHLIVSSVGYFSFADEGRL
jgi:DNA repair protein RadC